MKTPPIPGNITPSDFAVRSSCTMAQYSYANRKASALVDPSDARANPVFSNLRYTLRVCSTKAHPQVLALPLYKDCVTVALPASFVRDDQSI